ncbi:MAG TPA: phytanoyl-CoA dioxygenase family protein [Bryobacteraceae bacterium]|jgi:hypothetical protein|nr:phytanoyl-CoA dioxygenase family protein [Bryobacteraceae bacterium]
MNRVERIRLLKTEGWYVMESLLVADSLGRVRDAVLEQEALQSLEWASVREQWHAAGYVVPDLRTGRAQRVIEKIPEHCAFLADPRMLEVVEGVFGPPVRVSSVGGIVTRSGNRRGHWHADWPFNQKLASYVPAPYEDAILHLSAIIMLTDFSSENGATLIVPGTHRRSSNPTGDIGVDPLAPYPNERSATGPAGSVLVYDSRLWHAAAPNTTDTPRVALTVRYAPWWLNLEVRRAGSPDHARAVSSTQGKDNSVPMVPRAIFERLPPQVRDLLRHSVV